MTTQAARCQNCGSQLCASSTRPVRGFCLCKVCREIEVELKELMAEEIRLKEELHVVRLKARSQPCSCFGKKIRTLLEAIDYVKTQQEDALELYRSLSDKSSVRGNRVY